MFLLPDVLLLDLELELEEAVRRPPDEAARLPPFFFCVVAINSCPFPGNISGPPVGTGADQAAGTRVKPVMLSTRKSAPAPQQ